MTQSHALARKLINDQLDELRVALAACRTAADTLTADAERKRHECQIRIVAIHELEAALKVLE